MTDDLRARADARLERALATAGIRDPRPYFRPVLKHLKDADPAAFDRALRHFEDVLVPAVAGDGDPLDHWLEYGGLLATLLGDGRAVAVDGSGRAAPVQEPPASDALLLHLPADPAAPALVLRCPRDATPAQDATIELLVLGRITASAYDR